MPMPAMTGDAGTWAGIMDSSHFLLIVKIMEIIFGLMLLINFKRPLAWLLLLPIIVGIAMSETLIFKSPGIGLVLLALNFFMIYVHREKYASIFNS